MTDSQLIQKAIEEIELKTWALITQFINSFELVYEDSKPKVARIDRDANDGTVNVYFPVKDERFYFNIQFDAKGAIIFIDTTPGSRVYFRATSHTLDVDQLSQMTKLEVTDACYKGDRRNGFAAWPYNSFCIEPDPGPDEFEDKLKKLLDVLEQDKEGIKDLTHKAEAWIQVVQDFYVGNGILGGNSLDQDGIKRLAELNLKIDFSISVSGTPLKDIYTCF